MMAILYCLQHLRSHLGSSAFGDARCVVIAIKTSGYCCNLYVFKECKFIMHFPEINFVLSSVQFLN